MKTLYAPFMALGLMAATSVQAEVFKDKSSTSTCIPASNEEIMKRSDGSSVRKIVGNCVGLVSDVPAPYDIQKVTCFTTLELSADNKPITSHGYCEVLSPKGDGRAAYTVVYDPVNHGRWQYFSGSGVYAGVKGSGTYKLRMPLATGGGVYDATGTWEVEARK